MDERRAQHPILRSLNLLEFNKEMPLHGTWTNREQSSNRHGAGECQEIDPLASVELGLEAGRIGKNTRHSCHRRNLNSFVLFQSKTTATEETWRERLIGGNISVFTNKTKGKHTTLSATATLPLQLFSRVRLQFFDGIFNC